MAEPVSLYRRFRPQRFAEVWGQDFVVTALRNAVRDGRVAHAYLFSGPRGTGKTTTARLLAKALNCTDPAPDGDCCDRCPSCVAIREGSSLDVVELDAASNRGIERIRELISTIALGSPGRKKVYIVDEVHQLTSEASTALLKTLEEPPGHVVFVLATTDPQKVQVPVRSRTQHFEFGLLPAEVLSSGARAVVERAGIELDDRAIDAVVRDGRGSARDMLSVLEQVAAAGGVRAEAPVVDDIVEALAGRDAGAALVAVARALAAGRDPRRLGNELVERLRDLFLSLLAPELVEALPQDRERVADQARRMGPAATARAIEVVGEALVDLREAVEPRVTLEVALVRLARPELDTSPAALVERIERLERAGPAAPAPGADRPADAAAAAEPGGRPADGPAGGPGGEAPTAGGTAAAVPAAPATGSEPAGAGPAAARAALGAFRARTDDRAAGGPPTPARPAPPPASRPGPDVPPPVSPPATAAPGAPPPASRPAPDVPPPLSPAATPAPAAPPPAPPRPDARPGLPPVDELARLWEDAVLPALSPGVRARFRSGQIVGTDGGTITFAVDHDRLRADCDDRKAVVEAQLAAHLGRPVPLRVVVSGRSGARPDGLPAHEPEGFDPSELTDAPTSDTSPAARLLEAFPGAEEISGD